MVIKNKRTIIWFILVLLWFSIVLYFSLSPSPPQITGFWGWDKVQHAAAVGIFSFLTASGYLSLNKPFRVSLIIGFVAATFFGIAIELLQGWLTTNRQADLADVIADAVGAFITSLLMFLHLRKKESH